MTSLHSARDAAFISYSQKDRRWLCMLRILLKPYERRGLIQVWDDSSLRAGQRWNEEIEHALRRARVGVLLSSPDFFASDVVTNVELPALQRAEVRGELTLFCIPVRPADPDALGLASYHWVRAPDRPLSLLRRPAQEQALVAIVRDLVTLFA